MTIIAKKIEKIIDFLTTNILLGMTLLILVSVFFRYILHAPLFWTGEILRTLFIWVVFMGAVLVHAQKTHIEIEIFYKYCPDFIKKIIDIIVFITSTIFLIYLVKESFILTLKTATIKSAVLRYPMAFLNSSILFCSCLMILYQLDELIKKITRQPAVSGGN